jgi:hypothetical protein
MFLLDMLLCLEAKDVKHVPLEGSESKIIERGVLIQQVIEYEEGCSLLENIVLCRYNIVQYVSYEIISYRLHSLFDIY